MSEGSKVKCLTRHSHYHTVQRWNNVSYETRYAAIYGRGKDAVMCPGVYVCVLYTKTYSETKFAFEPSFQTGRVVSYETEFPPMWTSTRYEVRKTGRGLGRPPGQNAWKRPVTHSAHMDKVRNVHILKLTTLSQPLDWTKCKWLLYKTFFTWSFRYNVNVCIDTMSYKTWIRMTHIVTDNVNALEDKTSKDWSKGQCSTVLPTENACFDSPRTCCKFGSFAYLGCRNMLLRDFHLPLLVTDKWVNTENLFWGWHLWRYETTFCMRLVWLYDKAVMWTSYTKTYSETMVEPSFQTKVVSYENFPQWTLNRYEVRKIGLYAQWRAVTHSVHMNKVRNVQD